MSDIPFIVLLADAFLLASGLFTAMAWCPFLVEILKWHTEPPTLKKTLILCFGLFIPIVITYILVMIFTPEALMWKGG